MEVMEGEVRASISSAVTSNAETPPAMTSPAINAVTSPASISRQHLSRHPSIINLPAITAIISPAITSSDVTSPAITSPTVNTSANNSPPHANRLGGPFAQPLRVTATIQPRAGAGLDSRCSGGRSGVKVEVIAGEGLAITSSATTSPLDPPHPHLTHHNPS